MNATSKADFINSVAEGAQKPCPACETLNKNTAKFCVKCGKELLNEKKPSAPAQTPFAPAEPKKEEASQTPFVPAEPKKGEASQTPFAPAEPKKEEASQAPFAPAAPKTETAPKKVAPFTVFSAVEEVEEEKSVFAQGLPEWNIEPPQVMVRRKKSK